MNYPASFDMFLCLSFSSELQKVHIDSDMLVRHFNSQNILISVHSNSVCFQNISSILTFLKFSYVIHRFQMIFRPKFFVVHSFFFGFANNFDDFNSFLVHLISVCFQELHFVFTYLELFFENNRFMMFFHRFFIVVTPFFFGFDIQFDEFNSFLVTGNEGPLSTIQ